jgi:hypothetical protein
LRYRLRTLLILLAVLPPLLWFGWTKYEAWQAEQERQKAIAEMNAEIDRVLQMARSSSPPPFANPPVDRELLPPEPRGLNPPPKLPELPAEQSPKQ